LLWRQRGDATNDDVTDVPLSREENSANETAASAGQAMGGGRRLDHQYCTLRRIARHPGSTTAPSSAWPQAAPPPYRPSPGGTRFSSCSRLPSDSQLRTLTLPAPARFRQSDSVSGYSISTPPVAGGAQVTPVGTQPLGGFWAPANNDGHCKSFKQNTYVRHGNGYHSDSSATVAQQPPGGIGYQGISPAEVRTDSEAGKYIDSKEDGGHSERDTVYTNLGTTGRHPPPAAARSTHGGSIKSQYGRQAMLKNDMLMSSSGRPHSSTVIV